MKTRVYRIELFFNFEIRTFEFAADNKDLAYDHAFFSLANDEDFVMSHGRPMPNSLKFVGYSEDGSLDDTVYI